MVFAVLAITGALVLNLVNSDIQADTEMAAVAKTSIGDINTGYPTWFDYGVVTVLVMMWIVVIVASRYVDAHPIFFGASIIVMAILLFAVNQSMEAIDNYVADVDIATVTSHFPITMFIINHMEKLVALVAFTILIALYAKVRE